MSKRYRTIVADPPWPIRWSGGKGGRRQRPIDIPYSLMDLEAIKALPVADLADEGGAHLYMWVTPEMHRTGEGLATLEGWGFRYCGELIWKKRNFGMGAFPRPQHEPVLIGRRGNIPFARKDVGSVQEWPNPYSRKDGKIHSAKPDGFLDLVESNSPGPYVEMFARRARFNWDYWGDQSLGTARMPGEAA